LVGEGRGLMEGCESGRVGVGVWSQEGSGEDGGGVKGGLLVLGGWLVGVGGEDGGGGGMLAIEQRAARL